MDSEKLKQYLTKIVDNNVTNSVMIWGPPGIGKSSVVSQVAQESGISFIDVRLSQLAPTDLRGLPVAKEGISSWYPPEFLPTQGKGILFMDEINMAPPTMQGVAQQLVLDRQVGSYKVPEGWLIWAAGNRKEDKASVFEMPAPLANRFVHLSMESDFDAFKAFALAADIHEHLIAFLSYRPALLHKMDPNSQSWPSPRSWMMANDLYKADLEIYPAIGQAAAAEFNAYTAIYKKIPDLSDITSGKGKKIPFPKEPDRQYAVILGLTTRSKTTEEALNSFRWLTDYKDKKPRANHEWTQLFASDLFPLWRAKGKINELTALVSKEKGIREFLKDYMSLLAA